MKTTKSIIAALLAVLMLFSAFSVSVFAALPPLTDLKWNDDFSASFSFEGAAKYSYTIYINGTMIWGYGSTYDETITHEKMMPYMAAIAAAGIKDRGISGDAEFELRVYARDSADKQITVATSVKKTLNINDVADGKLAPSTEKWQFKVTDTSDAEKLKNAFYAAYDSDKEKFNTMLAAQGITYDQYIFMMVAAAQEKSVYTFTGTLAQVMEFCFEYNQYSYNSIELVNPPAEPPVVKKISEVNITITAPKAGQKVNEYTNTPSISCSTEGVKVVFDFSDSSNLTAYENNTRTWSEKFYSGNSYDIAFLVSFEEGYAPAEYFTVKVNGHNAEWVNDSPSAVSEFGGYYCTDPITVQGNFFQNIITFFHNLITKIKYPNGMPV